MQSKALNKKIIGTLVKELTNDVYEFTVLTDEQRNTIMHSINTSFGVKDVMVQKNITVWAILDSWDWIITRLTRILKVMKKGAQELSYFDLYNETKLFVPLDVYTTILTLIEILCGKLQIPTIDFYRIKNDYIDNVMYPDDNYMYDNRVTNTLEIINKMVSEINPRTIVKITKSVIKTPPETVPETVPETETEKTCAICLDSLDITCLETLTCMHVFHKNCIARWLSDNTTCPMCRTEN